MMKYTVVLPTLNEEENIGTMIRSLMSLPEPPAEIRVVDDHSSDGTQQVVTGLEKEYPGVVHFMLNAGRKSLSASVVTGFDAASTEILLCMDAD
ncbi:MAG: glycosyltransferase, partial [Lentisphaeria bacterium]|nr:glycosyltransferase [Lentisphaeria bacterium]